MEPRPTVRQQLAEQHRVLSAQIDEISVAEQLAAKGSARMEQLRGLRDAVLGADCKGRAARAATEAERTAWLNTDDYLRAGIGFEVPGGLIVLQRELRIDHLPTLPTIDQMMAEAERDLQPHLDKLLGAIDAWERQRSIVTATMTADLPHVEMRAEATVRERHE